jgi:class 3 adenylate cyclase
LARAFASHGGTVVDVEGDGFFVVFRRTTDAILAGIDAQLALAMAWQLSILVGMGVDTGEAVLRGEHYVGQEVHRASRICTAAHGGQIVLSQATVELVHSSMPDGVTLVDLGEPEPLPADEIRRNDAVTRLSLSGRVCGYVFARFDGSCVCRHTHRAAVTRAAIG